MKTSAQLGRYLKMGEGIERKGINFYSNAYKRVIDPNSKGLLKFLIAEEKGHLAYFLYLEKKHKAGAKLAKLKKLKNPVFRKDVYKRIKGKKAANINIFETALDIEVKSIRLYMKLSRKVKERQLKRFLVMLAGREKNHYRLIRQHKDAIYNFLYWQGLRQGRIET
ncbi:hypothetical protein COV19_01560 [Candidatus Woesearchaeota archaeon CG10_big_fil_rev_8_21_14_0_10_44_13]|nr:MAG: hypothetical protein COV19_01560 [Candidatus Woesearchaeota archaeon CG10_big_fil_rev_8_21_14_0_10_44_13]